MKHRSTSCAAFPSCSRASSREQANVRFERCHLKTLGDSALQFELAYFVQQPSVNPLLDLQQAVNFRIIDEFRRLEVEFDYPDAARDCSARQRDRRARRLDVPRRAVRAGDSAEYRQRHSPVRQHRRDAALGEAAWDFAWTTRACSDPGSTITISRPSRSMQASMPAWTSSARARLFAVETAGRHVTARSQYRAGDAFLFGPETRGLPPAVLERVGRESLFIPMRAQSRSINLIQCRGAGGVRSLAPARLRRRGRGVVRLLVASPRCLRDTATQRPPMCVPITVPWFLVVRPSSRLGRPMSTP